MKSICLYFQVHQPMRLRRYRFFDIGNSNYYYDDYLNESIMHNVAKNCYLPANKVLLDLIKEYGTQLKVSFSITGIALDQFRLYAPEVLESFQQLVATGSVELLAETYSHSLVSLKDEAEFNKQVQAHSDIIKKLFNYEPKVFRNTELVYSDEIGERVANMGFKAMLTEGANHILGWKSPNYMYCNAINPKLKVLLRNYELSDDIAFRFSNQGWDEYPLTAEKYVAWLNQTDDEDEIINLYMDYETFGEHHSADTGIIDFLKEFPKEVFKTKKLQFKTPSELVEDHQPISTIHVPHPVSWADAERDLTAWLGNNLQEDAYNRLYTLTDKINKCDDKILQNDWKYLQASDHFYYMCTKVFSDGEVHSYFNPYDSPYDAYMNYMNALADFMIRLNSAVPETEKEKELAVLASIIYDKNIQIEKYEKELKKLKAQKTGSTGQKATTATKQTTTAKTQATTKKSTGAKNATSTKKSKTTETAKKPLTKKTETTKNTSRATTTKSKATKTSRSAATKK